VNIPLYRLREDIGSVAAPGTKLVVYCNTGERSAAAACVLKRLGYEVSALHGGLGAMLRMMAGRGSPTAAGAAAGVPATGSPAAPRSEERRVGDRVSAHLARS